MRRIIGVLTAAVCLAAATAAYASPINTYTGTYKFSTKSVGTAKKPVAVGITENLAANGTGGNRTAVLLNITTKIFGLKADQKDFPTCSAAQITAAKNDTVCPKGALIASGNITATLGNANNFGVAGAACDPDLDLWNSGNGKATFFFVDTPTHQCLGGQLTTGSVGPYPATLSSKGGYMVLDTPIPSFVDYPLGPGVLAGSLQTEHLVFAKQTKKVHGKTVASIASVACKHGKRPYLTTFTAAQYSGTGSPEVDTVKGSAPCKS